MEAKRELNNPYGSKLDSANLLILGMEGLLANGRVPVSWAAFKDAGTKKDAVDRQKYGAAHTCIVLYAIVVELVVKHIWEQQQGKTAEHHHDVHCLFKKLRSDTRCYIESLYGECCVLYKNAIQVGTRQHGSNAVAVEMANLEEALHWNKDTMKNLIQPTKRGMSCSPKEDDHECTALVSNQVRQLHWAFAPGRFCIGLWRESVGFGG